MLDILELGINIMPSSSEVRLISAKAEICEARFSECFCCGFITAEVRIERLANLSAAKTFLRSPYDAYENILSHIWQMIALCGITSLFMHIMPIRSTYALMQFGGPKAKAAAFSLSEEEIFCHSVFIGG